MGDGVENAEGSMRTAPMTYLYRDWNLTKGVSLAATSLLGLSH